MPTPTTYRLELDHGRTIISLQPQMNEIPWSDIEKVGSQVLSHLERIPTPAVLVDLTGLDYMGSAQVALVVRIYKSVKERGGKLIVANRHPIVQEVLALAGLNKLWTIVESREAGMKLLGGPVSTPEDSTTAPPSTSLVPASLSLAAIAVALVGLVALVTKATWLPTMTAIWVELIGAGIAFVLALWSVLKGGGSARTLGAMGLIGSVALLLAAVFHLGSQRNPAPATTTPPPTATTFPVAPSPAAEAPPVSNPPVNVPTTPTPEATPNPTPPNP